MKIGFFTDTYRPRIDGVVTSIENTARGLQELGHEVYIFAPKVSPKHEAKDPPHVQRITSIPMSAPKMRDFRFSLFFRRQQKFASRFELDVVHSHTHGPMGLLAHRVAQKDKIPHVSTIHTLMSHLSSDYGVELFGQMLQAELLYPLVFRKFVPRSKDYDYGTDISLVRKRVWDSQLYFLNQADYVVAPLGHVADKLKKGNLERPCSIIPSGVDIQLYEEARKQIKKDKKAGPLIVNIGRMSWEKRQDVVIQAFADAASEFPNARLALAGDGPALDEYRELTESFPLEVRRNIEFLGALNADDVAKLLCQADISTLASYNFDTQALTILESLAAGAPLVYCDPSLTHGTGHDNALCVRPTVKGFANGFRELLGDTKRLKKMSRSGLKHAHDYDNKQTAEKHSDLYRQLLQKS